VANLTLPDRTVLLRCALFLRAFEAPNTLWAYCPGSVKLLTMRRERSSLTTPRRIGPSLVAALVVSWTLAVNSRSADEVGPPMMIVFSHGPIGLEQARTDAWLVATHDGRPSSLARHDVLILEHLTCDAEVGVIYQIFINLPTGENPKESDPRYVGAINFYDSRAESGRPPKSFRFEVTDVLRYGMPKTSKLKITFLAQHPPETSSHPRIARAAIERTG
jgi:hypothetical protein